MTNWVIFFFYESLEYLFGENNNWNTRNLIPREHVDEGAGVTRIPLCVSLNHSCASTQSDRKNGSNNSVARANGTLRPRVMWPLLFRSIFERSLNWIFSKISAITYGCLFPFENNYYISKHLFMKLKLMILSRKSTFKYKNIQYKYIIDYL